MLLGIPGRMKVLISDLFLWYPLIFKNIRDLPIPSENVDNLGNCSMIG